jgi:hypothetical protein
MSGHPALPPPFLRPAPHTAPTYPIRLPPVHSSPYHAPPYHPYPPATSHDRYIPGDQQVMHGRPDNAAGLRLLGSLGPYPPHVSSVDRSFWVQQLIHAGRSSSVYDASQWPERHLRRVSHAPHLRDWSPLTSSPGELFLYCSGLTSLISQTSNDLYISNVPPNLPEAAIADTLRDCLPVRIKLNMPVESADRLKPDDYYDWMPRSGTSAP